MAVQESHGSSCRIYDGVMFSMIFAMPCVSWLKGIEKKGFPAKTISQKLSSVRSLANERIVDFAASMRLGSISSASIEREISSKISILCFSLSIMSFSVVLVGEIIRNNIVETIDQRKNQRIQILHGVRLYFCIRALGQT